jgi:hypothetical protein
MGTHGRALAPTPAGAPALTAAQQRYCLARAEGATKKDAAAAAGVSWRAVAYWQRKPALARALEARIDELTVEQVAEARRYLRGRAQAAAERLVALVDSPHEAVALRAAVAVLRLAGLDAPAQRGQPAAGPRIVIERAVWIMRDDDPPAHPGPVYDVPPKAAADD